MGEYHDDNVRGIFRHKLPIIPVPVDAMCDYCGRSREEFTKLRMVVLQLRKTQVIICVMCSPYLADVLKKLEPSHL